MEEQEIGREKQQQTPVSDVNNPTEKKCEFYLIFKPETTTDGKTSYNIVDDANSMNTITSTINSDSFTITFNNSIADYTDNNNNNITYKIVALTYSNSEAAELNPPDATGLKNYFTGYSSSSQTEHIKQRLAYCIKPIAGGNRFAKTIRSKDITNWRRNKSNRNRRQNKRI